MIWRGEESSEEEVDDSHRACVNASVSPSSSLLRRLEPERRIRSQKGRECKRNIREVRSSWLPKLAYSTDCSYSSLGSTTYARS